MADTKLRGRTPALPRSPIAAVLASCRWAFIGVGLLSGVINLLMLTGAIFVMQVYDRVLGSQSVPTLVALSLIAVAAYLFQGWLDILRARVLALIGERRCRGRSQGARGGRRPAVAHPTVQSGAAAAIPAARGPAQHPAASFALVLQGASRR